MSFSRLRRSNNPRPQNDDNYSNYSGNSNPQYQNQNYQNQNYQRTYQNPNQNYQNQNYQKYENQNYQNQNYQKYENQNYQNQKYNNDINKLQPTNNYSHASSETNSSATDQYICNNCINEALIDAKNKPKDYSINGESPMDIQDRLNAMQKMRINDQVQQRIRRAEGVAKNLNYTSDKDKLIKENEGGNFFKSR